MLNLGVGETRRNLPGIDPCYGTHNSNLSTKGKCDRFKGRCEAEDN